MRNCLIIGSCYCTDWSSALEYRGNGRQLGCPRSLSAVPSCANASSTADTRVVGTGVDFAME